VTVTADNVKNEVIITGDAGSRITLSWSSALLLGCLLKEASVHAEPASPAGRTYAPATERARV
jgi:hypothetical protein